MYVYSVPMNMCTCVKVGVRKGEGKREREEREEGEREGGEGERANQRLMLAVFSHSPHLTLWGSVST